jgi:Zn finger protein HypA/HybF involved in hydrogenase expression
MDFVLLKSFTNYIDAHILLGRLEEESIRCWLKDENTVTINPIWANAVGGIKLMVAKEQLERAAKLLQEFEEEIKHSLSCPKCGSHDIQLVSSPRKAVNWLSAVGGFLFGNLAIGTDKVWHCFNCRAEFKEPVEDVYH